MAFFEEDESPDDIRALFDELEKGLTKEDRMPDAVYPGGTWVRMTRGEDVVKEYGMREDDDDIESNAMRDYELAVELEGEVCTSFYDGDTGERIAKIVVS